MTLASSSWIRPPIRLTTFNKKIPGTGNLAHLEENVAAATLQLSREDFAELG